MSFPRYRLNSTFRSFGRIKKPSSFKGAVAPEMVEAGQPDARVHRVIDLPRFPLMLDTDNSHGSP